MSTLDDIILSHVSWRNTKYLRSHRKNKKERKKRHKTSHIKKNSKKNINNNNKRNFDIYFNKLTHQYNFNSSTQTCICGNTQMKYDSNSQHSLHCRHCRHCKGNRCIECHEELCQGHSFCYCSMCYRQIDLYDMVESVRLPFQLDEFMTHTIRYCENTIKRLKYLPKYVCAECSYKFKNKWQECSICNEEGECSVNLEKHEYNIIKFTYLEPYAWKAKKDIYLYDFRNKNLFYFQKNNNIITLDSFLPPSHYLYPYQQALRKNPFQKNPVCQKCFTSVYHFHTKLGLIEETKYTQCSACLYFLPILPELKYRWVWIKNMYYLHQEENQLKMINPDSKIVITLPDDLYDLPPIYYNIIRYLGIDHQMKYLPWTQTWSTSKLITDQANKYRRDSFSFCPQKKKFVNPIAEKYPRAKHGYVFCPDCEIIHLNELIIHHSIKYNRFQFAKKYPQFANKYGL